MLYGEPVLCTRMEGTYCTQSRAFSRAKEIMDPFEETWKWCAIKTRKCILLICPLGPIHHGSICC